MFIITFKPESTYSHRERVHFVHEYTIESKIPYLLRIWGNFDGFYYIGISQRGYLTHEQPFFPFYPLLIYLLSILSSLPHLLSALVISHVALFLSLIIISRTLLIDKKNSLLYLMLFIILLFPTSLFYGAAYNDALFLLFSILSIHFARKKIWVASSIAGGIATLTRFNGLALLPFIFFEYLTKDQKNEKQTWNIKQIAKFAKRCFSPQTIIKEKFYSILLIPLTFLGYLYYIEEKFGDWNLVFSSMKLWGQDKITFPLQVFWRYIKIIVFDPTFKLNYWIALLELLFVLLYIAMMIYSYKKIRFSYWILFVVSILIPSLTGTFQGMPRYGLHLYPFFLSLSLFLTKRRLAFRLFYFIVSISLLCLFIVLFTRGYFVA